MPTTRLAEAGDRVGPAAIGVQVAALPASRLLSNRVPLLSAAEALYSQPV